MEPPIGFTTSACGRPGSAAAASKLRLCGGAEVAAKLWLCGGVACGPPPCRAVCCDIAAWD